jgi:hypothetical protein
VVDYKYMNKIIKNTYRKYAEKYEIMVYTSWCVKVYFVFYYRDGSSFYKYIGVLDK